MNLSPNSKSPMASLLPSLRFGGGAINLRTALLKVCGLLQKKTVLIFDNDPELCGEILASSATKGTFIEHLFAIPAWKPILSIESTDGSDWENLSRNFQKIIASTNWKVRWNKILENQIESQIRRSQLAQPFIIDSFEVSRMVLRVLFELVFNQKLDSDDENLFFRASLEWRKEIGVKAPGNERIKKKFVERIVNYIPYDESGKKDISWISAFAQPFLISPQINVSDIFAALYGFLRADSNLLAQAKTAASTDNKRLLDGFILESIRLKHPFPILEREIPHDMILRGRYFSAGTQVLILLDQFNQDQTFEPTRWQNKNSYGALIFASGPRMCPGKSLAMDLMRTFLKSFLTDFSFNQVQPELNHMWSGRDNDSKNSKNESRYQNSIFINALVKSFRLGKIRERRQRADDIQ